MRKLVVLSAVLAATLAVPAVAKSDASKITFTRDGVTYTYTETKVGKSTIYKGRAMPGNPFYLVVRGDQVVGTANGIPVQFDVAEATAKAGSATVAMK